MLNTLLPQDAHQALLIGRLWVPDFGAVVCAVTPDDVFDLAQLAPTSSQLLELPELAHQVRAFVRSGKAPRLASTPEALANSDETCRDASQAWFMAPCDLQAVKAAGVTFPISMLERVIEERARGDLAAAAGLRAEVTALIGDDLTRLKPGSPEAAKLKEMLIARGAWSQYLEVGIGPDAEIFTKAQPMAAIGTGMDAGVNPVSTWNNPEPEVVLVVASTGRIVGATLGNDVNLRDVEGRSALLLSKAKDNNASAAIGPFIRFLDQSFGLDDLRTTTVSLTVAGTDNFRLEGASSMTKIARDITDLAAQMVNAHHRFPDGAVLYCGTMFAPIDDRGAPGKGFTHKTGDIVTIATPKLGRLVNRIKPTDQCAPWDFGIAALMRNLAKRGLL